MKLKYVYVGVLLVGVAIFAFVYVFGLIKNMREERRDQRSVMVGKPREASEKTTRYIQTIQYGKPKPIHYYPWHVIEVSLATLDTTDSEIKRESSSEYYLQGEGGYGGGDEGKNYVNYTNLVFLNNKYQQEHTLLDKKGLILEVRYPENMFIVQKQNAIDSLKKIYKNDSSKVVSAQDFPYILYTIVFEDTNQDGRLNENDKNDLYISDVNGKNLKKIGKDIKVLHYELWNNEKKFLVTYFERKEKPLYRKKRFGFYDIASDTFTPLTDVYDALQKVEKILIQ